MLIDKIHLLLHGCKYMGLNNNIVCGYNYKTKMYQFWYKDGIRFVFLDELADRTVAKFKLFVLSKIY